MELRIGGPSGKRRCVVRLRAVEVRRWWTSLFVLSLLTPMLWGLGSSAAIARDAEAGDVASRERAATPADAPLELAANFTAAISSKGAEERTAKPRALAPVDAPLRLAEANIAASPSEAYARRPLLSSRSSRNARRAAPLAAAAVVSLTPIDPNAALAQRAAVRPLGPVVRAGLAPLPSFAGAGSAADASATRVGRVSMAPGATAESAASDGAASPKAGGRTRTTSRQYARRAHSRLATSAQLAPRAAMHNVAASSASSIGGRPLIGSTGYAGRPGYRPLGAGDSALDSGFGAAAKAIGIIPGLSLENVMLFSGYSSNGAVGRSQFAPIGGAAAGADLDFGTTATIAFRKPGRTTDFAFTYTPSRIQRGRISQWNSTDHRLALSMSKDLSPRWGVAVNGGVSVNGLEQAWFRPPTFHRVDNPPETFEDLIDRVAEGGLSDDELASVLTGVPVVDDPGGAEYGLSRVLSLNVGTTASYAYSPRVTMSFGVGASRYQLLSSQGPRGANFFGRSDAFMANFDTQYELSYRDRVGFQFNTRFNDSDFQSAVTNEATMSFARKVNRHWSFDVRAGAGVVSGVNRRFLMSIPELDDNLLKASPVVVFGGSLRRSGREHSFSVNFDRRAGDTYGTGGAVSYIGGFNWNWQRVGSDWGLSAGANYQRTSQDQFSIGRSQFQSTFYNGGFYRALSSATAFRTDYTYGRYQTQFRGLFPNVGVHRLQVALVWRPAEQGLR